MDADVVAALTRALHAASDWHTVASNLRREAGEGLEPHQAAFSYIYAERANTDYRARYGPLAPLWELSGKVYPAPLDRMTVVEIEAWIEAFEAIDSPLLRARYGDLLWLCRAGGTPHRYARDAIAAYASLAGGDDELMTATHAAQRSIELALELNDTQMASSLAVNAVDHAAELLSVGMERPGAVMRLLEASAALRPAMRPPRLLEVALTSENTYSADPNLGDAVADLLAGLTVDSKIVDQVRRRQLTRWQAEISATTGLLQQGHLQHALELAALHQLGDIRVELRRQFQAAQGSPLELHELGAEVQVPSEGLDRLVASIVGDDTAVGALTRLASQCPVGDPANVYALVADLRDQNPIRYLSKGILVGDDNMTIRYLRTPDEHFAAQVAAHEAMRVRIFGAAILLPALDAIVARYGVPDEAAVSSALTSGSIDSLLASRLALAVGEFFAGADDRAAHLIVPRLERGLRELARQAGVIVVREPAGEKSGGVRPLGAILDDLREILSEDWRRYFANLLTDELGINLRNRIAHGLVDEVQRQDAALLVHAVFCLSLFRLESSVPAEGSV